MYAHIAYCAFEFVGEIHYFGHTRVLIHFGTEFGHIIYAVGHCLLQLFVGTVGVGRHVLWNELCEQIGGGGRIAHHSSDILDGRFRGHGTVGDDMGNVCGTVTLGDVVEYRFAAVVIEVNINIGERDTVGVEESFEEEVVFQGVNLRDAETIRHY